MLAPAIICAACAGLSAAQGFEDRLPGEVPAGWRLAWGRLHDDVFAVSNHQPFAGRHCWLLERPAASTDGQYGVSTRLAALPGTARLSMALRLDGPGTRAPGIELRAADGQRCLSRITFSPRRREVLVGSTVVGRSEDGRWMRFALDWPAAGGPGSAMIAPADAVPSPVAVTLPPRPGEVVLMVCVHVTGFTLRLDDLDWGSHDAATP